MKKSPSGFASPMADDFEDFLAFKRARGHPYLRAEFTLRAFDRFVVSSVGARTNLELDRLVLDWLASMQGRKPVSVANEVGVIRQFCLFLRRRDPETFVPGRVWAPQSAESQFLPHIFSEDEIRAILTLASSLRGRSLHRAAIRTLILVLYCTGLRFGEAVRLRLRDVDLGEDTFLVGHSKGRSRLVPFHTDLADELKKYMDARSSHAPKDPDSPFFVRGDGSTLSVRSASDTVRRLLRRAGLKPPKGRSGARPYDLRHTFAVHRLTRWYRDGVDVNARLSWLSAYMGHLNMLGTECYLQATPELLALTADRFEARFARAAETQ